jgi:hypothetical protein
LDAASFIQVKYRTLFHGFLLAACGWAESTSQAPGPPILWPLPGCVWAHAGGSHSHLGIAARTHLLPCDIFITGILATVGLSIYFLNQLPSSQAVKTGGSKEIGLNCLGCSSVFFAWQLYIRGNKTHRMIVSIAAAAGDNLLCSICSHVTWWNQFWELGGFLGFSSPKLVSCSYGPFWCMLVILLRPDVLRIGERGSA